MAKKNKQALGNVIEEGVLVKDSGAAASIELKKSDRAYRVAGILVILITFGALLGWASTAPLMSAVVAAGEVKVASRNKVVQHLDGGRVKEILVKEGNIVEKDTVLLRMDDEDLRAQYTSVQEQIWESLASQERLKAERDSKPLKFSSLLQKQAKTSAVLKDILKTQRNLFSLGGETLDQGREVLVQRRKQAEKQITGNNNILRSLHKRESLLAEDIAALQPLVKKQLIPQNNLRDKQRAFNEIKGDISSRESEIARLKEVIAEQSQQMGLEKKRYLKDSNAELRELERRHIDLVGSIRRINDRLSRIEITAPVAGKIEKFDVVTIGAVLSPGQAIMEIVPQDYNFSIIANVALADIDAIYVGQAAEIRLSSFDDARYFDVMYAEIENIASDSSVDEVTGFPFYKTRLSVSKEVVKTLEDNKVRLVAGMPTEVVIKTGDRTVLEYLVKPLTQMIDRSFNEH
jgi:HlyD family type I secretion membrane fusion protein